MRVRKKLDTFEVLLIVVAMLLCVIIAINAMIIVFRPECSRGTRFIAAEQVQP